MSRFIIVPEVFLSKKAVTDRWLCFFDALKAEYGFEVLTAENKPYPLKNVDVVFICATPKTAYLFEHMLSNLDSKTCLISCVVDIHKRNTKYDSWVKKIFDKSNVLLNTTGEYFLQNYPEYRDKHMFFPTFYAPNERYESLPLNESPKQRVLFSGAISKHYPLRLHIATMLARNAELRKTIDMLPHPGVYGANKRTATVRDDYAKLLNSYYACIATPAVECLGAKHSEIMASGSLLLAERIEDMDRLGMIPNLHYVPIDEENVFEKIKTVLAHPKEYMRIRKMGMFYSRHYHSLSKRIKQFGEIVFG